MDLAPPSSTMSDVRADRARPRPDGRDDGSTAGPGPSASVAGPATAVALPPGVPATWPYPAVAIPRLLDDAARDFPDVVAVSDGHRAVTNARLAALADELAAGLRALGARRVVLGVDIDLASVLAGHAAWRLGIPVLVLPPHDGRSGGDQPVHGGEPTAGDVPAEGERAARFPQLGDGDVAIGDRRTLARAAGAQHALAADVGRLLRTRSAPLAGLLGRVGPRRPSLSRLETAPAAAGPVDPDTAALQVPDGRGGLRTFTQADLVVATFQVRLWLPDMAAGVEHIGAALPLGAPGLAFGPLLAALVAGTLHVRGGDHLAALRGVTVAVAEPSTWHALVPHRVALHRRGPDASRLRIGGVLVVGDGPRLPADVVRRLSAHTGGARLRHFWQPEGAAGPVVAQPVYGRIVGDPGAVPLPDTVLWRRDGRLLARGPQLRRLSGPDGWADVTEVLPSSTRPTSPVTPTPIPIPTPTPREAP